jgi:cystathionine beta-lyase
MTFDFDRIIPRTATNAVAEDGFETYLFGPDAGVTLPMPHADLIQMWVADMQFAAPPPRSTRWPTGSHIRSSAIR